MFQRFRAEFRLLPAEQVASVTWQEQRLLAADGYTALADRFAGCSFENGMYRLHDATSGPQALTWIGKAFPELAARACPFGYDWLGRQFAVDTGRQEAGQSLVLLLEPATGEALEIPRTFAAFHDEELVQYRDAALASVFFDTWAQAHAADLPLARGVCVGYRVPLFLGGGDSVDNLELIDLDVYWTISGQLRRAAGHLPGGTPIKDASAGE